MNKKMLFTICITINFITATYERPIVVVTAADDHFYPCLLNFIGAIHKVNFNELGEIAIFDLGFTPQQRQSLNSIAKVHVYTVEMTHPELLKHFVTRPNGRKARGHYAWKPVIIKQALDMFDDIIYIDSGILILKPLNNLIKHIRKHGYFLIDCNHPIVWMATGYVKQLFDLNSPEHSWILDSKTYGISAGFQGLTHKLYDSYVLPMYELSKNLKAFEDDGTSLRGFGWGRHDQTLFSIYARLLGLHVFNLYATNYLDLENIKAPFTFSTDFITGGLENLAHMPHMQKYIRYT